MASTSLLQDKRRERSIIQALRSLERRIAGRYLLQLLLVFVAYVIAGKLGQATTQIRSSNLGPVWPAYGVALAAFLTYGYRVWPAVMAAAFLVAFFSPVPHLAALGQAVGATVAAMTGAFLLYRIGFNRSLARLSDVLNLIVIGGFGSALVSASIGILVLYAAHVHAYSGLGPAWLIYWLGDATGVLLVTPLVLTASRLLPTKDRGRITELVALVFLLTVVCFIFFKNVTVIPAMILSFAVLPFVMWAAIRFGVGATALSILIVAAIATVETALGSGPFASHSTFVNATLLDVFFAVLSVLGLSLAAVIAEREHAEREHEQVVSQQAAMEARLEAAHELRMSEERWRLAARVGKMYAYEWDVATDRVARSGEVANVLGTTEMAGLSRQQLLARVHPDDRALFNASVSERTPASPDSHITYRVLRPDGSVIWLEKIAHAFFDEQGKMLRMVGMVSDVTERKRVEERLREYEKAVEDAEEMIAVIDREYRYLIANRQFLKMRNMTREQVVGRSAREVLNPGVFDGVVKEKFDKCFEGKVVRYEMKYTYPELGERDIAVSYFPIEGPSGIDRVACILQDVTERKHAEKTLHAINRALEEQTSVLQAREVLLKNFVKNVPAGVAMLDRDMRYLQVSDRWCADYSLDSSQVLGRSHYELFPDMPDWWKQVHRRALEGETLRAEEDPWDREGGKMWVRWEVRPWRRGDGLTGGILIFAEDITRRKQMEETLSDLSRKLIESQEQERTRIARELHDDINQRLALLAIEIDGSRQNPPQSAREMSRLLGTIWENIVAVSSQVQSISHQLHSSQLEYLGVVVAIRSFCHEFVARQKVQIDFTHDEIPAPVSRDVSLCLFRVLQEALHNAFKHSNTRHFEVRLRCSDDQLHLVVADSGRGFNLETASNKGGLGLISMRERVRLVNGTIAIESKPMAGTKIDVRVPFDLEHAAERAAG